MECKSSQMVNITKASFGTLHLTPAKKNRNLSIFSNVHTELVNQVEFQVILPSAHAQTAQNTNSKRCLSTG